MFPLSYAGSVGVNKGYEGSQAEFNLSPCLFMALFAKAISGDSQVTYLCGDIIALKAYKRLNIEKEKGTQKNVEQRRKVRHRISTVPGKRGTFSNTV